MLDLRRSGSSFSGSPSLSRESIGSMSIVRPAAMGLGSLKGTSLGQTVDFLYLIENASAHLIIRSIRIRARGEEKLLDVSFSVSSFERA